MKTSVKREMGYGRRSVSNGEVWKSGKLPSERKKVFLQNVTIIQKNGEFTNEKVYYSKSKGHTIRNGLRVKVVPNTRMGYWRVL